MRNDSMTSERPCDDSTKTMVYIGRINGNNLDNEVFTEMSDEEIEATKDALALVNRVTGDKDQYYIKIGSPDADQIVPVVKS